MIKAVALIALVLAHVQAAAVTCSMLDIKGVWSLQLNGFEEAKVKGKKEVYPAHALARVQADAAGHWSAVLHSVNLKDRKRFSAEVFVSALNGTYTVDSATCVFTFTGNDSLTAVPQNFFGVMCNAKDTIDVVWVRVREQVGR